MKFILALFHFLTIALPSKSQDMRTLVVNKLNDVRYDCIDPGCSSSIMISVASFARCYIACISSNNCRTVTFDQSTKRCQLFTDFPSQYGTLTVQNNCITLIAIENRILSFRKYTIAIEFLLKTNIFNYFSRDNQYNNSHVSVIILHISYNFWFK